MFFVHSDDKLLYINSPDSYDSGIQADVAHTQADVAHSQADVAHTQADVPHIQADVAHIRAPQTEDLYAVVKKPSKTTGDDIAVRHDDSDTKTTSEVSRLEIEVLVMSRDRSTVLLMRREVNNDSTTAVIMLADHFTVTPCMCPLHSEPV